MAWKDEFPVLTLITELLSRSGLTTSVYPNSSGDRSNALVVYPKPEGFIFLITQEPPMGYLHLRIEIKDSNMETVTVGGIRAALETAELIHEAWLLVFRAMKMHVHLGMGTRFFGSREWCSIDIVPQLRKELNKRIFEEEQRG